MQKFWQKSRAAGSKQAAGGRQIFQDLKSSGDEVLHFMAGLPSNRR
jgi:hypothetical protein